MISNQFILPIANELVIDLFAGGGGASTGIEQAIGRHVDIAVNHDPEAVSLHQANHPQTQHHVSDVFEVDPRTVTGGRPVGLLWASPDCTFHSKARGGKPHRDRNKARRRRGLAWVVCHWARDVRPRVICLENVEEFQHWGPLNEDGQPCPERKGSTFRRWVAQLRNLGYQVEWRELRACDYGAPTIRKRLFLVARCDGQPIVWPQPTHGAPDSLPVKQRKLKPWRTAADCIDWSITAPSIFERERPLAEATMRRIAKGIQRYVIDAAEPFIVEFANRSRDGLDAIAKPLRTVTATPEGGSFALCSPTLIQTGYGERPGQAPRVPRLDKPLGTVVSGQKHALVSAMLAKHYGGVVGQAMTAPTGTVTTVDHHSLVTATLVDVAHGEISPSGVKRWGKGHRSAGTPLPTVTASGGNSALVTSNMVKLRGTSTAAATDAPVHTISAGGTHHAEVRAFLIKYYGSDQDPQMLEPLHTVTTKDRFGLVMVKGEPYAIVDIGLRMLTPRELYRAQGFPDTYVIDRGADGRPLTKTAQVRMCGNSVCPPLSRALVAANYAEPMSIREAA